MKKSFYAAYFVLLMFSKPAFTKNISDSNFIYLEPSLFLGSIEVEELANNARGTIISKNNLGINVEWIQEWKNYASKKSKTKLISTGFFTKAFFNYQRYSFAKPLSRTIDENNINVLKFGFGTEFLLFYDLYLGADAFFSQEVYFRAPSTSSITFDQTNAYGAKLFLKWDLIKIDYNTLGIKINYTGIIPNKVKGSYEADYANSIGGSLYFSYKYYTCEFSYERTEKNTELFKQVYSYIYFKVGTKWSF